MVAFQIWSRDRRHPFTGASFSASGVTLIVFFFFSHRWDTEICESDVNKKGRVHKTLQSTLPFQSDSLFHWNVYFFFFELVSGWYCYGNSITVADARATIKIKGERSRAATGGAAAPDPAASASCDLSPQTLLFPPPTHLVPDVTGSASPGRRVRVPTRKTASLPLRNGPVGRQLTNVAPWRQTLLLCCCFVQII